MWLIRHFATGALLSNPPLNPERAAAAFASAERLRINALAQAATAAELCIVLAIQRIAELDTPVDGPTESYDIRRLQTSMREYAKAHRDPSEALVKASATGDLDFPPRFGEGRASKNLRAICKQVLSEINIGRAALPAHLESIELTKYLEASPSPTADTAASEPPKAKRAGL
jgi:hypothetical protein